MVTKRRRYLPLWSAIWRKLSGTLLVSRIALCRRIVVIFIKTIFTFASFHKLFRYVAL